MNKIIIKYNGLICFVIITIIYFFTKFITFKGFNGTDDLHYAMLASDLLKGRYTPFAVNDIFSGRILLIAWQAFIYFLFGINTFSTQAGTLAVTVLCCYLTIFKLARYKDFSVALIASSLFYFNPVLSEATLGILPDSYVMLTGILVMILWKKILCLENSKQIIIPSIVSGSIIFIAMFFKESSFIFVPFLFLISLFAGKKKVFASLVVIATFFVLVICSGLMYFIYTGDFFFRVHQIINSNYTTGCNFITLATKYKAVRLTYGLFKEFILESFYPVIVAAILIILRLLFDAKFKLKRDYFAWTFIILLTLGLYFPFSLQGYQPLCSKARHFIFLLPFGVILNANYLHEARENKRLMTLFIITSSLIFIVCLFASFEKWYWMIYGLLLCYFFIQKFNFLILFNKLRFIMLSAILWIYMLFNLFFFKSNWFKNLQSLSVEINSFCYYFPDHDNMMHWELLHGFNDSAYYYSLEKNPFKIFVPYYKRPPNAVFQPGWFIVDRVYNTAGSNFMNQLNILDKKNTFIGKKCDGDVCAYFIDSPEKLTMIKYIIDH